MSEKQDIITIGECLVELSTNSKMVNAGCFNKFATIHQTFSLNTVEG